MGLEYDGTPYAAASFDYNADGFKDLFVSMKSAHPAALFESQGINGYGVPDFNNMYDGPFGDGEEPGIKMGGVSSVDLDNDGYLDFLVTGGNNGVLRLYHQDPTSPGNFDDWSDDMNIDGYGEDSWAGAWGDYNRDGQIDLYLCRGDANGSDPGSGMGNVTNVLLKNDYADTGEFINDNQKQGLSATASTASVTATWMDVDGDGDLDLFRADAKGVVSGTGSRLYINSLAGSFQDQIGSRISGGAASVDYISGVKWLDANNDGAPDMVLSRNIDGAVHKVLLNDGNGAFNVEAPIAMPLATAATGLEAWDYDLDGRQDVLYLPVSAGGTPTLLGNRLVNENVEFHDQTNDAGLSQSAGRVDGSIACDYDDDGDKDIYLGRAVAGGAFYYEARAGMLDQDAPVNNWVGVQLTQRITTAPTAAVGARVTFHGSNDFKQIQDVDGGSGRGGQNDFDLICGVGGDTGTITCDIEWPSGRDEFARELTIGEVQTIAEPYGFALYENTVSATYQIYMTGQQSLVDLIFTWETDYLTDPARDRVVINTELPPCSLTDYELSANDATVDWSVEPLANGRFRHTMRLNGTPCVKDCDYTYTVKSERDETSHVSQTHTLVIPVCATGH